jgi:NhaP-type Na+/H+ or K+/H+ antiporter
VTDDLAFAWWCIIVGALLVAMTAGRPWIARLPLSAGILYLGAGLVLGPAGLGMLAIDLPGHAHALERLAEIAVLISLFVAGFKLGQPRNGDRWRVPVRLATLSMVATVAMIALAGHALLGLSLGAAVLLGGILAPTDPVLASDVQLGHPEDRDRLRFSLTGEGALNDGTAFPFVMLGLGLLGLHDLGAHGWRWWAVDVGWAVLAGLAAGFALGSATGRFLLWLERRADPGLLAHEFVALGSVALAYGLALVVNSYGFLAVFAAGFALRRAAHPAAAVPAGGSRGSEERALRAVQHFNEQLERFAEVAVVVVIGALLGTLSFRPAFLWFVPLLFFAIRPASVALGTLGTGATRTERSLIGWFGIRGVGSLYYLAFAATHGVDEKTTGELASLTLAVVATSIVLHGISVTPLMDWYERRKAAARPR